MTQKPIDLNFWKAREMIAGCLSWDGEPRAVRSPAHYEHDFDEELGMLWYGEAAAKMPQSIAVGQAIPKPAPAPPRTLRANVPMFARKKAAIRPDDPQDHRFPVGEVSITASVYALLDENQIRNLIACHANGIWSPEREFANTRSLRHGGPIFSEYPAEDGNGVVIVWVLTDTSRTKTLVLLPCEAPSRTTDLGQLQESLFVLPWPVQR